MSPFVANMFIIIHKPAQPNSQSSPYETKHDTNTPSLPYRTAIVQAKVAMATKTAAVCCNRSEPAPFCPADAVSTTPPAPVPVGPPGLAVPPVEVISVPDPVNSAQSVTRGVNLSMLEVALRNSLTPVPKSPVY